ncbi:bifunctional oligoribonuclease/PAP phosphatase NrnA [Luteolibacter sp. GHJ8]|uniref:Bifunctional oligoribonuclease/PAP phosphatase NrnA n=1 Tax=Luteolibacter rhizosphaerae TaxID=2989719 RepID=A0ABT3G8P3_9BACT|nr:bifunctional oligoribonuclease/PAP phosphatase NrnA [Luteolibacter rhizosphaerae]MCW1916226.1 bifunctional oligoribonuclease/PAP phosphatase NrnA [Luteolibacter rhizosphaerae]
MPENASYQQIGEIFARYDSFVIMSHVRPDGDAIGSQLALGLALEAAGNRVRMINDDGLPDNLRFLPGSDRIELPPTEPLEDYEVAIALDTATKPRLGEASLNAASKAKVWLNIDHHKSNPRYGDVNHIDSSSPATGEILYKLITALNLPLPDASRDAIYVAVSTDTGSFQYPSTTADTYLMAADLIKRGLDVGKMNSQTYDSHPYRRVELTRALLNTLELTGGGRVAHWELTLATRDSLGLKPEDSEGLIDMIRAIEGVTVALFFEELDGGKIRVSMRSKDPRIDASDVCGQFGGGGHALAAGIRMAGPLAEAKQQVLAAVCAALPGA